ncbi:MAG: hypothetical protein ACTS6G_02200 [Candidatus Hodgkinia cicadicola]
MSQSKEMNGFNVVSQRSFGHERFPCERLNASERRRSWSIWLWKTLKLTFYTSSAEGERYCFLRSPIETLTRNCSASHH